MSRGFMFKTILIYEALAIVGWNIMARTEADYEKWLFENIHAVVYITLSTTMLFVTMVYVIQWSLDKLGLRRKMAELQDPRRTDEEKKKDYVLIAVGTQCDRRDMTKDDDPSLRLNMNQVDKWIINYEMPYIETSAKTDKEAKSLLTQLGLPFKKN